MKIDSATLKEAIATYEERKRELIGDDPEERFRLKMEIKELLHTVEFAELINERFKNLQTGGAE